MIYIQPVLIAKFFGHASPGKENFLLSHDESRLLVAQAVLYMGCLCQEGAMPAEPITLHVVMQLAL